MAGNPTNQNLTGRLLQNQTGGWGIVHSSPNSGNLQFTPWVHINAENATLGQKYEGGATDQWTDAAGRTIAQNTQIYRGTKSFQMSINQGETGFGVWGGRKNLPAEMTKGDVLCYQVSVYIPSAFNMNVSGGGRLKFLRSHVKSSAGANRGYNDFYLSGNTSIKPIGTLQHILEYNGTWADMDGEVIQRDVWETFEVRVHWDNVAANAGGTGRTIMWRKKNGVMQLILDRPQATLVAATDLVDAFLMFTYWNGSSPANNVCYADDIILHNNLNDLVETDSAGNKIIGGVS